MNAALFYRPRRGWLFWMAFACAAAIHVGAVVFAQGKADKIVVSGFRPPGIDVQVVDADPQQQPSDQSVISSPLERSPDEETLPEEDRTPTPVRHYKRMRNPSVLTGTKAVFGSAKGLVIYAPRPVYPYEARRQRIVGSGIARVNVDPGVGNVTNVRMTQTCGNLILDNATLDALRRWRFKPGSALSVEVPITYTLAGVSY